MAYTKEQIAWIKAHGGTVGVVSEPEAQRREREWEAKKRREREAAARRRRREREAAAAKAKAEQERLAAQYRATEERKEKERLYGDVVLPGDIPTPTKVPEPAPPSEVVTTATGKVRVIKLGTDELVAKTDFEKLTPTQQHNLMSLGTRRFTELQRIKVEKVVYQTAKQKAALKQLDPYRKPGTPSGSIPDVYSVEEALKAGVSATTIGAAGFSTTDISKVQEQIALKAKLEPFKSAKGYNIREALKQGITPAFLRDAGFARKDIEEAQKPIAPTDVPDTGWALIPWPRRVTMPAALTKHFDSVMDWEALRKASDRERARAYTVIANEDSTVAKALFKKHGIPAPSITEKLRAIGTVTMPEFARQSVPVYSTIVNWNAMTPTERAISIAIDLAIIVPLTRAAALRVRAAKAPIQTGAKQLIKEEAARNKDMVKLIRKHIGKDAAAKYKDMAKLQTTYINALTNQEVALAKAKGIQTPKVLRQQKAAEAVARRLETKVRAYTNAVKMSGKAGFDSPQVMQMFDNIPREVIHTIKATVSGIRTAKPNIKQLRQQATAANQALTKAQAKYPRDTSKWADLLFDAARAESRLAQAQRGSIASMTSQLTKLRTQIAKARGTAKARLQKQAAKLQKQIDDAIRTMEVEYGAGGALTKGKGDVAVLAPPKIGAGPRVGAMPFKVKPLAPAKAILLPRLVKTFALGDAEMAEVAPMVHSAIATVTKGITSPEVISAVEEAIAAGTEAAAKAAAKAKTAGLTDAAVRAAIEAATAPAIKASVAAITSPAVKAAVQAKLQPMARVAVKLALATPIKPKWLKIPFKLPDGTTVSLTRDQVKGMIAWRQGIMFKAIYPPFGKNDAINSRQPIVGITYARGVGSAARSIVARGGKIPPVVMRDMGVMDITIRTPQTWYRTEKRKPKIRYKRDPKGRTRVTPRRKPGIGTVRL